MPGAGSLGCALGSCAVPQPVPQPRSCQAHEKQCLSYPVTFPKTHTMLTALRHLPTLKFNLNQWEGQKNYCGVGLKHTGETSHSQCPYRSLISLGNWAKIVINQAMLPREAVPVRPGQAGCCLEALRLRHHRADPSLHPSSHSTQTHACVHAVQGLAWGESSTSCCDTAVARLSQCTHLHGLRTGDITELGKQQLFDAWKEQKKKAIIKVCYGFLWDCPCVGTNAFPLSKM